MDLNDRKRKIRAGKGFFVAVSVSIAVFLSAGAVSADTVINQKNKGIASYSNNSFKVNVPKHSVKEYSITIKKNSISGGKADLRNTNIEISGERVKL